MPAGMPVFLCLALFVVFCQLLLKQRQPPKSIGKMAEKSIVFLPFKNKKIA